MKTHYNVLFLCTGNSARSIMAEAIMNAKANGRITAYSAGSHPTGRVRPEAIQQLQAAHISTEGLRSKSWDEFSQPYSPELDFVITVCDKAANEACPYWPSKPMAAHWSIPDPASDIGSEAQIAKGFRDAFFALDRRISLFLNLPLRTLDNLAIKREMDKIGQQTK